MGGRRDLQATMLAFVDLEERVPTDSSSAVAVSSGGGGRARPRDPTMQPTLFLWAGLYARSMGGRLSAV